jgi:hypothetical protein
VVTSTEQYVNGLKLGKLPARIDTRTLRLARLFIPAKLPALPDKFDNDDGMNVVIESNMFGNDQWGDCVIAGRANWTLRAEYFEQNIRLPITTDEVLYQYWKEQGGNASTQPDNGLVMLNSLNVWRHDGWTAAKEHYNIYAYAAINWKKYNELKYAILLLGGAYTGFWVPSSAMDQFDRGETWTVVPGSTIAGGHAIYLVGYNEIGPVCLTWGKKQQMTWEFFLKYTDEAYAMIDDIDSFKSNSPVNIPLLSEYLKTIVSTTPSEILVFITTPNGDVTNVTTAVNPDGKFNIKFIPSQPGTYTVDIDYIGATATIKVDVIR